MDRSGEPFVRLPAIYHTSSNDTYFTVSLDIFGDGSVAGSEFETVESLGEAIENGTIVFEVPDGSRISISDLCSVDKALGITGFVFPDEVIKELDDIVAALSGRPTSLEQCSARYHEYSKSRTAESLEALRTAYARVPRHCRALVLGDMDAKDGPIRRALGLA